MLDNNTKHAGVNARVFLQFAYTINISLKYSNQNFAQNKLFYNLQNIDNLSLVVYNTHDMKV